MACKYKVNGKESEVLDETLKYVEDVTMPEKRSADVILKILEGNDLTVETGENEYSLINDTLINERRATIDNINAGAKEFFGVSGDLLTATKIGDIYRISVNKNTLTKMKADPDAVYRSTKPEEGETLAEEEEQEEDVVGPESLQVEEKRELINTTTEMLVVNLEKQLDRLKRIPETKLTKSKISEMEVLKRELQKIKKEKVNLDDYMDFVSFVVDTSERAERLIIKISDKYTPNYQNVSQKERAKMLNDLTELKKTIDAFYNNQSSKSLISHLEELVNSLDDNPEDIEETLVLLETAAIRMKKVNDTYLNTGLEIQVDYLMSFAPPEINLALDKKIQGIKDTNRIDGLARFDARYIPARRKGMEAVLALNIQQLKEKKIGRESILQELKQTHKDQSIWSAYFSPLVYNKEASIQLFAESIRKALTEANDKTLETKYDVLQAPFLKFKSWKMEQARIGEDNVEKLYEDVVETVLISTLDSDGNRVDKEVLAFVQEFNMNKFNLAKAEAFAEFRESFGFPESPSEYTEFFETLQGKAYLQATAEWYDTHTEPVDGALDIIRALRKERNDIYSEIQSLKVNGHSDRISSLYLQYNNIKYELQRSYRNGKYIGKLSKPKKSMYSNDKFTNMPAEAREYYNLTLDLYKKDQKQLGRSALRRNSWDDFSYILPSIRKSTQDRFIEQGFRSSAKDLAKDEFQKQETDTEFGALLDANGDKIRMIPQYYTNVVEAYKISRDLTNSIIKFNDMANRYSAKSEILGVATMMEVAVQSRKKKTMTSTGNYLLDSAASKLGFSGEQHEAIDSRESNTFKQLQSFIDNIMYGRSEAESGSNDVDTINMNKVSNFAITMTAFSTLAANWLQAGNQLILDKMSGTQEAVAGEFYGMGDIIWARSQMAFGGQLSMLNDKLLPKFGKKNKLAKFLEKFDAFQLFGNEFGKQAGTAVKKLATRDTGMILQQGAEMLVVAERALAMASAYKGKLLDSKGKVILKENGKEANLYDLLIENDKGRLILDPRVANFNQDKFTAKLHGMLKRTNQLKGSFDRVLAQRGSLTKLVTLFRNYLVPGLRKRFGNMDGAMIDVEMAAVNEGYYATFMNTLINAGLDAKEGKFGQAVKRFNPGIFRNNNSDTTQANMRRFYYEVITAKVLALLATALIDLMDDDEEESYIGSYTAYQLLRLHSEWSQFRTTQMFDIMQDPTAAVNPIQHLGEALHAVWKYGGYHTGLVGYEEKDIYYQKQAGRWNKGDPKVIKEILDFAPILRGTFTAADPEEARRYYDIK